MGLDKGKNKTRYKTSRMKVLQLLQKGAVVEVRHHPEERFHSTLFLVPRKEWGQRLVINL